MPLHTPHTTALGSVGLTRVERSLDDSKKEPREEPGATLVQSKPTVVGNNAQ